jgi:hypothetical protein
LDQLKVNIWAVTVQPAVLQQVLSKQQNLSQLTFWSYYLNDDCLKAIAAYPNLDSINLGLSIGVSSNGLVTLLQSTTLLATLKNFELHSNGSYFNDDMLQALTAHTQLTSLTLHGYWDVSTTARQTLFQTLNQLKTLDLWGLAFTPDLCSAVGGLTWLTELRLDDCSRLFPDDYTTLLQGLNYLQILHLRNSIYFNLNEANVPTLLQKPLKKLSLTNCKYLWDTGLKNLCDNKNIQENLKYLEISGSNISSDAFGAIGKLKLKTLRIDKCHHFNDASMRKLSDSKLTSSLEALELEKVSISDAVANKFDHFKKLNTLMIAECYALTTIGSKELLKSTSLYKTLKKLYIEELPLTKEMIPLFGEFKKLEVLYIGNPGKLNIFKWADLFYHLPNIEDNNADVSLYDGILFRWKDFKNG